VDTCPIDCIHPRKDEPGYKDASQLFIEPGRVHRVAALASQECPVGAIYHEDDVPEEYQHYIAKNREAYQ
jgi:ferredoxin